MSLIDLPTVPPEPGHVPLGAPAHAYCPVCECGGHERPCWCCGYAGPFVPEWALRSTNVAGAVGPLRKADVPEHVRAQDTIRTARLEAARVGNPLLQTPPR